MKIEVPEAEILRTPIKIEKLSLWNKSTNGFIMNLEFHTFLKKKHSLPVHYFATSFGREIVYSLPVHYFATSFGREIVYFSTSVYIKEIVYFATTTSWEKFYEFAETLLNMVETCLNIIQTLLSMVETCLNIV